MTVVGMQEDEYGDFILKIRNAHERMISSMESMSKEMYNLVQNERGLGMEQVDLKIELLLKEIGSLRDVMRDMFEIEENQIESFQRIVENYDTLG